MGKDWKDDAYEAGVNAGKEGGFLDDIVHNNSPNLTERDELWQKGYKYGSEHRDDSGSSELCYITRACVRGVGLRDDCRELTLLRAFRDHLLRTEAGRMAVAEYNSTAPLIVRAIEDSGRANEVWPSLYAQIKKAAALVEDGAFTAAFEHYRAVTGKLKEEFLG